MIFKILAIDPNYEDLTSAAYQYRSENVYAALQTNNLTLVPLINSQADADPVSSAALQDGVVYITGVGHGEYDTFHGYFNHPVFSVADLNPSTVAGKIVHLLSCETGNGLGPDMVALGCRAFFGYSVPFTYDPRFSSIFFACDAQIDLGLAAGHSAAKVASDVRAFFEQSISENPEAAAYLRMNLDNFCSPASGTRWGKSDATLFNG